LLDRETIIETIQSISKEIGGSPGRVIFERLSGIPRHQWYGRYWASWSEALRAAGLTANPRKEAIEETRLLADYVALVQDLGRVPTDAELGVEARRRRSFPATSTFRARFGSKHDLLDHALAFAIASNAPHDVIAAISVAFARTHRASKARFDAGNPRIRVAGYVYMMRSGNSYKIGRSIAPDRRQFEIGLHLPDEVKPIHAIRTDDPSGIEAYWHRRFSEKRLNGEWFRLTRDDVTDFKRRKFM
jgi:hypothetical protein